MSSKYCPQCGKPSATTSNFCGSCGSSLNSLSKTAPSQTKSSTSFTPFALNREEEDDDDSYLDRLTRLNINIDHLEIEVSQNRVNKETLGSFMTQRGMSNNLTSRETGPYINADKEEFLKGFSQEAGNSPSKNEE